MDLVFIYGPPGVGKLTVAQELARLTGYRLFDNHASIDVIRRVFDFNDEAFWPLVRRLRYDVLEAACQHGVSLISTGAYAHGKDTETFEKGLGLIDRYDGRVCLVHLTCSLAMLEQRVQSEGRTNKMHSLETVRADMTVHDYFTPLPGRESCNRQYGGAAGRGGVANRGALQVEDWGGVTVAGGEGGRGLVPPAEPGA
jgi:shikimate kinase